MIGREKENDGTGRIKRGEVWVSRGGNMQRNNQPERCSG